MPDIARIILRSGPCFDSIPLLRLYLRALEIPVLKQLAIASRLKFSPGVLDLIRLSALPAEDKGRLFSRAMTLFRSGTSYKTTGAGRTRLADAEILKAAGPGALILETGVSDGASAAELLAAASGAEILLSDVQVGFPYSDSACGRTYYLADGGTAALKTGPLYFFTGTAGKPPASAASVSALNPMVQEKFGIRGIIPFDIFTDALPRKAAAIKCANVLNLVYFTPEHVKSALVNLRRSLAEGGLLVISQNNPGYAGGEAVITLTCRGGLLELEREQNSHELLPHLKSRLFADIIAPEAANG